MFGRSALPKLRRYAPVKVTRRSAFVLKHACECVLPASLQREGAVLLLWNRCALTTRKMIHCLASMALAFHTL